ncbi:MAG: SDR family oxidoreductase [Alphaproteobacteria bacterium]|jgi:NAD(P)-dependent dehydrogenase (short-subunit alcohol dehydrogenase family)|nr:SDR family oxidoreductase [Alphaproteobacteria bacterium]
MSEKVAVVTAAGSGMGAGVARELAARGYGVAILSSSGKGEALAEELGGVGVTGSNLVPDDLARLVDLTMARWGRIDALVNSAGHAPKGPLLELTDEDWHLGLDAMLLNIVRMCRLVTPVMEAQGKGAICNITTYATFEPEHYFPLSGAFRAGVSVFAKLYADQYAAAGIRINNLLPGFIDSLPEKDEFRQRVPMGRYGTVEEVAKTAAFLVSDEAGYITGQNLRVDGGITRSV